MKSVVFVCACLFLAVQAADHLTIDTEDIDYDPELHRETLTGKFDHRNNAVKTTSAFQPEEAATDPQVDLGFRFAHLLFQNIRTQIQGTDYSKEACQWLYTYIQSDWATFAQAYLDNLDSEAYKTRVSVDIDSSEELALADRDNRFLRTIVPNVFTHKEMADLASGSLTFNEVRSFFAERRKRSSEPCVLPNGKPVDCAKREKRLQQEHPVFANIRGRASAPRIDRRTSEIMAMTPRSGEDFINRQLSARNRNAGIVAWEFTSDDSHNYFKLPVRHAGKSMFQRKAREHEDDPYSMADLMDIVGAPFIAGPSGTAKQVALTIEAASPRLSYLETEQIIASSCMLVLAGGHHSYAELVLGMQIMGYFRQIPSVLRVHPLTRGTSYDPESAFLEPLSWSAENQSADFETLVHSFLNKRYDHTTSMEAFRSYLGDINIKPRL